MINVYNTLNQKKEQFKPINDKRVKLFVCGPTVYDDAHIGHARTYISFDIIKRYLQYKGFTVFYLQNVTDIDDKIINRAKETGVDPEDLARKFEKRYRRDMELLGVKGVNFFARATDHILEIISQIETLLEKGFAYETETGVYFNVSKFSTYGNLSRRKLDDLDIHRVNIDKTKKNPADFALWKKRDDETVWDSPWGPGRPGWHIEDTAITEEYFGPQYDIHGGGLDLIFPHHEAEIAQMEASSGKSPMVKYWMHTGFLNVSGEKMSKSLGNFITIKDLLENYDSEIFRFFVLSTHYRSPIDFSEKALDQAGNSLKRIKKLLVRINELYVDSLEDDMYDELFQKLLNNSRNDFFDAMDNDFNTPQGLATIFNLTKELNKLFNENIPSKFVLSEILSFFNDLSEIMGIDFNQTPKTSENNHCDDLLDLILDLRVTLREKKEWDLSDKIRFELGNLGIEIEDK